jgi:hypothetical protein
MKPGNQSSYMEQLFSHLIVCEQVIAERNKFAGKQFCLTKSSKV